ncbi:MAG TPA: tripartite tricarboxylate transporter substrate binding protein [Pseudorhodoferax sp.]|nr:tripartite tricarboxylate transporter substrate binding protein [Pseudorhodoferax sp.]
MVSDPLRSRLRRALLRSLATLATLAITAWTAAPALAATYPERPVRVIVPYPAGGTNDIVGRAIAEQLSQAFGQSFFVENRAGGGGTVGIAAVARAAADGYTLAVSASGPVAVGLSLYEQVPYDVRKDLVPVSILAEVDALLVARADFRPHTIPEVIAWGKAPGNHLKIAVSSIGSMHHLLSENLRLRGNLDATLVPYKGATPALAELVPGLTDIVFENLPALKPFIDAGRLRPIAVTSSQRSPLLPNVPTVAEQGFPELSAAPWFALLAPAGTPNDVVAKLNAAVRKALASPEVATAFAKQGARPTPQSLDDARRYLAREIDFWHRIVVETGTQIK